jgi:hypothetical protein
MLSEPSKGNYSLIIKNVESGDNGQYNALATNSNGEVIAAFSLITK